ncbi:MAG: hypothetical protein K6G18_08795, partial [Treponema sp.]|nr:hypothetical protein [Treponema sp.]
ARPCVVTAVPVSAPEPAVPALSDAEPAPTAIPTPAMSTPVAAPEPAVPTASSTESAPSAPASPEPNAEPASKPAPLPLQKVMPKKDNATPNDHHIANFKKMNRIASRPSVANDKKVSAGSFVAYKPASSR